MRRLIQIFKIKSGYFPAFLRDGDHNVFPFELLRPINNLEPFSVPFTHSFLRRDTDLKLFIYATRNFGSTFLLSWVLPAIDFIDLLAVLF